MLRSRENGGHLLVMHCGLRQPLGEEQRLAKLQGETDVNQPMYVPYPRARVESVSGLFE